MRAFTGPFFVLGRRKNGRCVNGQGRPGRRIQYRRTSLQSVSCRRQDFKRIPGSVYRGAGGGSGPARPGGIWGGRRGRLPGHTDGERAGENPPWAAGAGACLVGGSHGNSGPAAGGNTPGPGVPAVCPGRLAAGPHRRGQCAGGKPCAMATSMEGMC